MKSSKEAGLFETYIFFTATFYPPLLNKGCISFFQKNLSDPRMLNSCVYLKRVYQTTNFSYDIDRNHIHLRK